jgi:hypothetical protein
MVMAEVSVDHALGPFALTERILNVYEVPLVKPETVEVVSGGVPETVKFVMPVVGVTCTPPTNGAIS